MDKEEFKKIETDSYAYNLVNKVLVKHGNIIKWSYDSLY